MQKNRPPENQKSLVPGNDSSREIVVPHLANAGPVTAVKNVLIQFSLAQLKSEGHYERYAQLVEPAVLEELLQLLGPGWIPIELAHKHYEACERMRLEAAELAGVGVGVGQRLQQTVLVAGTRGSPAELDMWKEVGSVLRMWPRVFRGGSVQLTKLGATESLVEQRGLALNRYAYVRQAQINVITAACAGLGLDSLKLEVAKYSATRDELTFHCSWS
jgi:hypothetical protein